MKTVGLVVLFIQVEHMSVKRETKASVESRSCAKSIRVCLTVIRVISVVCASEHSDLPSYCIHTLSNTLRSMTAL